jgi:phospholipid/cholesterol/gamma-HCH transport system substrate-binding protein
MNDRAMRFRIGIFVLAAFLLLAILVTLFGSFPSLFKRHANYIVTFTDAPGIAPGTPVRKSGVRIGEVSNIVLDEQSGEVRVTIVIESKYHLRHNDLPTLVTGLLGGDTSIDMVPRQQGADVDLTEVQPGEVLQGARVANVSTLLTQASQVVPTTQETLAQMQKSLQRFERLTPQMEDALREYTRLAQNANKTIPDVQRTNQQLLDTARELEVTSRNWGRLGERLDVLVQTNQDKLIRTLDNLNDTIQRIGTIFNDENQKNLNALLKNVRNGSEGLDTVVKHTDELLTESQKTMKRIGDSVDKADEALFNLNKAMKPLADRGDSIARNLDESTDKLNKALGDVQDLMRAIDQGDGTFRKLIADPSLYNNIDNAVCQVTRMLPRVERMLKDLEVFTDKLARHPELIGVGGAIRPSSGLKEAVPSEPRFPRLSMHP